jgi:hypothetical protein
MKQIGFYFDAAQEAASSQRKNPGTVSVASTEQKLATMRESHGIRTIKSMRCRFALRVLHSLFCFSLLVAAATYCQGDAPPFDLAGPKVDVHVQRNGVTLPIAEVPNLLAGDRLWIHPDLPESQSTHYILIVAFLRGATNPPPADWFKRVETWNKEVREEGVFVVVPAEAQQALIFLAPETTGDFTTLRKAVHDRPGAFVRAGQDLQQASWDRLRLDTYLAQVKELPQGDPKLLKEKTELAARSLGIRVDQQCFDKPTEQQAPCLTQHTDGLVLDDSNAQGMVNQMANGAAGDMMNQMSYSTLGGAGAFSPYVGAVLDLARILSTLHTARFQYIPALALPQKEQKDTLNLRLNVPPSFRDPKSVIVVALPPVGDSHPPQMHASNTEPAPLPATGQAQAGNPASSQVPATPAGIEYCASRPDLALAAEGAPLVFGTAMAHDLVLHVDTKALQPNSSPIHPELTPQGASAPAQQSGIDVPVIPNPSEGGFVLTKPLPSLPEAEVTAELRGRWGFDPWVGPRFHLDSPHPGGWTIPASDRNALITGRDDVLHIQGETTLCVEDVDATVKESEKHESKSLKLTWKSPKPELIDATVPLRDTEPGTVTIAIHQYGLAKPEELTLQSYAEAAAIEHLTLSAGDKVAVLKGKRLDEVSSADLAGITFSPAALNRVQDYDQLEMAATGVTATLQPGNDYSAKVTLRDGRTLHVPASVEKPRPQVELLSKGVQHDQAESDSDAPPVRLGSANDLPLQRKLVFFVRSRVPAAFPRNEKIELAAVDGSFGTTLSLADGSLMLEDSKTAVAVLDPYARFGASAFGPVQFRAVSAGGVTGDWVPLGTLVRLPGFTAGAASRDLRCPRNANKPCQLSGNNLFLITEISATPDMANPVEVPPEFAGTSLTVPNITHAGSNAGTLYLKLRDDPDTVQTLNLPVSLPGASSPGGTSASEQGSNVSPGGAPALIPAATQAAKPDPSSDPQTTSPASPQR